MTQSNGAVAVPDPARIPQSSGERTGFRGDIQGIRALAVLLVLAYHAGVPFLEGGYVGVDVFFVVSGFLITGLMVREVRRTGRLSLSNFYARRARRLLPAAATVLVASGIMTLVVLPVTRWPSIARDIGASALYIVNWRFAGQSVDYLTSDAAASPVLHYWSLAVEEQFYIVWPVLLLVLLSISRSRAWSLRTTLLVGIGLVTVASFAWSVSLTGSSPGPAFFVTTTRMWEFGIGAGLALVLSPGARLPRVAGRTLSLVGIGSIVVAALAFGAETRFPGYAAVVPTLGTAALIAGGSLQPEGAVQHLLSLRPMRWIGDVSYSLYLWHWPPLVAATWLWSEPDGMLPVSIALAVVAISFIPAWLGYRLVEAPIHFSKSFARLPKRALALGVSCTALGLGVALLVSLLVPSSTVYVSAAATADLLQSDIDATTGADPDGSEPEKASDSNEQNQPPQSSGDRSIAAALGAAVLDSRPRDDPEGRITDTVAWFVPSPVAALDDGPTLGGEKCIQGPLFKDLHSCTYGPADAETVVAVVGDSKMAQWLPAIQEIADQRGWRVVTYLVNRCALARIPVVHDEAISEHCDRYNDVRYQALLENEDIDYVITSQRVASAFLPDETPEQQQQALVDDLRNTWLGLEDAGKEVIVLLDNAAPLGEVTDCVAAHPEQLSECSFQRDLGIAASAAPTQSEALVGLSNVAVVDMQDWICPRDVCPVVIGNVLIYRRGTHLTATYVRTLSSHLDTALETAMTAD